MSFGWSGRILRVDLSELRSWVEDTEAYALRGWDQDGIPAEDTFLALGLTSEWQSVRKSWRRYEDPCTSLQISRQQTVIG